jgi:hypothetical protein
VAAPTLIPLDGDLSARLQEIPAAAGVGQILGPEDKSLVIGRPPTCAVGGLASRPGPAAPSGRATAHGPAPVARALQFTVTTSGFQQRLVFERVMALYVAPSARRDLEAVRLAAPRPVGALPAVTIRATGQRPGRPVRPFRNRPAAGPRGGRAPQAVPLAARATSSSSPRATWPLGLG